MPVFAVFEVPLVNGTWVPPLWFGVLCVPLALLTFFAALHLLNAWGWVCARWAELLFRGPAFARGVLPAPFASTPAPPVAPAPPVPGSVVAAPAPPPGPSAAPGGETDRQAAANDAAARPGSTAAGDETTS
jgi:hypothetical protein